MRFSSRTSVQPQSTRIPGNNHALAQALLLLAVCATLFYSLSLGFALPVHAAGPDEWEAALQRLTNADRTSNGRAALLPNAALYAVARDRSNDMVARQYFSHYIPPDGTTVKVILNERKIAYKIFGENIAYSSGHDDDIVEYLETRFLASPEHRQNIMDARFTHMGLGAAVGSYRDHDGVKFFSEEFIQTPSAATPTVEAQPTNTPLPPVPTNTPLPPAPTDTEVPPAPTDTPLPAPTDTPVPATDTPAPTGTPVLDTPTVAPTETPIPTNTPRPTVTPVPTNSATAQPTPTSSAAILEVGVGTPVEGIDDSGATSGSLSGSPTPDFAATPTALPLLPPNAPGSQAVQHVGRGLFDEIIDRFLRVLLNF